MFRTIIISKGEKIRVKDNWLIVIDDMNESKIPIGDIYSIVVDNPSATISMKCIDILTKAGVHILICDDKHMPYTIILSQNNHYRPYYVLKNQINISVNFKNLLWDKIIISKITNQARVLKFSGCKTENINALKDFAINVQNGDSTNREALASRMFFKSLYGSDFIRMSDDSINAALNFGYAIIRSAISKALSSYGFNCALGIHHIGEGNAFNLADDLMEPFRPVIDMWVNDNIDILVDGDLSYDARKNLIDIVNHTIMFDGKKYKIRTAIDKYIKSYSSAIEKQDADLFKFPLIMKFDIFNNCDEDE